MADVVEVERALAMVKGFDPIQRVLLTCTGTLQGTLSAWFGGPMEIAVVEQTEHREKNLDFARSIEMRYQDQCVMRAFSGIRTTREDVKSLVKEQRLGLGQILEKLEIRPEFVLVEAEQDDESFWRVYELHGAGMLYRIKEIFPKCWYTTSLREGSEDL